MEHLILPVGSPSIKNSRRVFPLPMPSLSLHQQIQHRLLGVEAVFRLVEDLVSVGLKDLGGDLLPPVGGEAVLHHGLGVGHGHHGVVDLVPPQTPASAG